MTNATIINATTIKSGKMQFNVTTGKNFRDTLAKWHSADFDLAEKIMEKNDRVKALRAIIDTDRADLEKLEKGERGVIRTAEEIQAEIHDYEIRVSKESEHLAEYKKAQATRYEGAHKLLTKDLYKAYCDYITDGDYETYFNALCVFLTEQGFEPRRDSIDKFIAVVGKRKNSTRNKIKTGKHNGANTYNAWRDIFLGEICDVLVEENAIPVYKFTYVLKEDRKAKKDAK